MSDPVSALVGQRFDLDAGLAVVPGVESVVLDAAVDGVTADVGLVGAEGPPVVVDDVADAE